MNVTRIITFFYDLIPISNAIYGCLLGIRPSIGVFGGQAEKCCRTGDQEGEKDNLKL